MSHLKVNELVAAAHVAAPDLPPAAAELMQSLAARLDVTFSALKEAMDQRGKLATDSAALKCFIHSDCYVAHIETETFYESECTRYVSADGFEPETPATDAFLAEVRAQGVESAGEYLKQYAQGLHEEARLVLQDASELCNGFAAQLRQEAK
ncbi:hypothetical protein [Citrobacter sp. R56]|uniref:hypothetical protein n=1 Tax=Citrobacter sp. R56 TaxID=1573676 RepID=UPI00193BF41D|nr:hypothetical protein [Citrobacter sp. R56]QRG81380.1 hypothetical protein JM656_09620 [Citrobacter sp. R56]